MSGEASDEEVLARGCLDKALEGLARPLKVRQRGGFLVGSADSCPTGADTTYRQVSGRNHRHLPDCQSGAVLPRDDAAYYRAASVVDAGPSGVSQPFWEEALR